MVGSLMHAIDQARDRYGLALRREDVDTLIGQIMAGKAVYVRHDGPCDIYLVKWQGVVMVACYDPNAECIKTFLPADYMTPKGKREHHGVKKKRLRVAKRKGAFRMERDEHGQEAD